jgi:hypothetical protein
MSIRLTFALNSPGNGTGPSNGTGPLPPGGSAGAGGTGVGGVLSWVSLGFLGPSVGASSLVAIQLAFAALLLVCEGILVTQLRGRLLPWSHKASPRRKPTPSAVHPVKVRASLRAGYRAPPSARSSSARGSSSSR